MVGYEPRSLAFKKETVLILNLSGRLNQASRIRHSQNPFGNENNLFFYYTLIENFKQVI